MKRNINLLKKFISLVCIVITSFNLTSCKNEEYTYDKYEDISYGNYER